MDFPIIATLYFIINFILMILSLAFCILKKKENAPVRFKLVIDILIIISITIYLLITFGSFSNLRADNVVLINLIFLSFCFSSTLFFYSLYEKEEDIINLKNPTFFESRKGTLQIGKSMKKTNKKFKYYLSMKDLGKHMFVCGATGTGKSNFIQNFLINFSKRYKIPFLLVEFKGEYHFLQKLIENLIIIKPGENFSINIFNPEGTIPEVHAERIFDILKSGHFLDENAEFSPQMEKVLVEILTIVCKNEDLQSWNGFYEYCELYSQKYEKQIPMLNQTLISIKNRIRRFSLGALKALFDTRNELKVNELLERNVLIDLSSIIRLGGEKSDALFFLNMILKYLWDKNITRGAYNFKGIKHITIVEDVQYFAPKELTKQTKLTTYLEDIALLQRGTGECLVSIATHPEISKEILANCGALIVFKSYLQREFLSELLNLEKEKQYYLSILEEGQCIIRVNSIKRPFLLSVPYIKRDCLTPIEINDYNRLILESSIKSVKSDKLVIYSKNDIILQILKFMKTKISLLYNSIRKVKFKFDSMKKKEEKKQERNEDLKTEEKVFMINQGVLNQSEYSKRITVSTKWRDKDYTELEKFVDVLLLKEQKEKELHPK